jgi:hypothetical protein
MPHSRSVVRRAARAVSAVALSLLAAAATYEAVALTNVRIASYAVPLQGPAAGSITLDQANAGVVVVALSSSNPQVVSVPSGVPIQPNSATGAFVATGVGPGCAKITGTLGTRTRTEYVVVHPASTASTLTLTIPNQILPLGGAVPSSVRTGIGPSAMADVSLSSSNPSIATVPASVRLQRGSAQFTIATRGEGCATITATLGSQIVRRTVHVVWVGG